MIDSDEAWLNRAIAETFTTSDQLLARIEERYATSYREVTIGNKVYRILRAADADAVLDEAVRSEQEGAHAGGWEPFWAEAWDSAVAIGAWLVEQRIAAGRIMDLGCGVGLAGAVAADLGASVVLGDSAPPSLLFAKWNLWPWRERSEVKSIDWRADRFDGPKFDWILGADIVYAKENWIFQDQFVRHHLAPGGGFLLAEPQRRLSDEFADTFKKRGWHVEEWEYRPQCVERELRMFCCRLMA